MPFIAWCSSHFANFASLIFPAPGGPVWRTLVPLFHRWRGSSAEGMWQAQGHIVSPLNEPRIETLLLAMKPGSSPPVNVLAPMPVPPLHVLYHCPLALPPNLALSFTPPSGDPRSRLAWSTFWMILSEEQLILETLVLWKGYFSLTSWISPKGHTNSCSPLHVFGADMLVSIEKLVIRDTDSILETRICRVRV